MFEYSWAGGRAGPLADLEEYNFLKYGIQMYIFGKNLRKIAQNSIF